MSGGLEMGEFSGNQSKKLYRSWRENYKKQLGGRLSYGLWRRETNDITKQVCMVQPKAEIDLQFESTRLSTTWGYVSAIALCVTSFGTVALMRGFFLKPDAMFDDYVSNVVPLFGDFLSI